jgi:hypothetical protein
MLQLDELGARKRDPPLLWAGAHNNGVSFGAEYRASQDQP